MQTAIDLDRPLCLHLLASAPGAGEHPRRAWKVLKAIESSLRQLLCLLLLSQFLLRLADLTCAWLHAKHRSFLTGPLTFGSQFCSLVLTSFSPCCFTHNRDQAQF